MSQGGINKIPLDTDSTMAANSDFLAPTQKATKTALLTKKGIGRSTFSNANYTVLSTDRYVAQTGTLGASRTVTMCAANSLPAGEMIIIADEGNLATFRINVQAGGADTINGITGIPAFGIIRRPGGSLYLMTDGVSKWIISDVRLDSMNTFNTGGVSGTTSETEIIKIPIEAKTLAATNDCLFIDTLIGRVNTNGNIVLKLKFSTDGNLPAGTTNQLGTVTMAATTKSSPFARRLYTYTGGNIISGVSVTANILINDAIATTDPVFVTGFDVNVKNWIHLSATPASALDGVTHYIFRVTN